MLEIKHLKTRMTLTIEEEGISFEAWNAGGRRTPAWEIYDLNKRDATGSNYASLGSAKSRQEALTTMCLKAKAPMGSDVITYTQCSTCKSLGSQHHPFCENFPKGEREPKKERTPRPKKKVQDASEIVAEPLPKVQLRTNIAGIENRNFALRDDEVQVECQRGAVSVLLNTPPKHGGTKTVTVCTVRGIPSRQAQFAEMDLDELDAFLALLEDARKGLKQAMNRE